MSLKIGVFVGSLRKESYNRKIANSLIALAPSSMKLEIIEIGNLPLYNEDLDLQNTPESWLKFRKHVKELDGVLFITAEYNRSVPAALKNALDVGSRPYGQSVWAGKPGAIISSSVGAVGGFGANHHLRQSMVFLDVPCMQQPEAYIGNMAQFFDEKGQIANPGSKEFLQKYIGNFEKWVTINQKGA